MWPGPLSSRQPQEPEAAVNELRPRLTSKVACDGPRLLRLSGHAFTRITCRISVGARNSRPTTCGRPAPRALGGPW
jgi:hypothetical protein